MKVPCAGDGKSVVFLEVGALLILLALPMELTLFIVGGSTGDHGEKGEVVDVLLTFSSPADGRTLLTLLLLPRLV